MKIKILLMINIVALALIGCNKPSGNVDNSIVVVSLQPQKYFLDKLVGDKIKVECLLENGANPESYEPSMNDLMMLEKSVAYFKMGNVGFEQILVDRLKQNNKTLNICDVSQGIDLIVGTHECCEHHHGHKHSMSVDPHTWTSVKNAKIIVRNMYDEIVRIDTLNKELYKKNYDCLVASLDSLDNYALNKLADCSGCSFLVWHPSLSYFARDYGLEQMTMGQVGKELSAKQLHDQIDKAKKHNAKVFFFQREFDSRQASVLNEQIGAKMVTINPLNYEWEAEIRCIIDAISSK